LNDASLLQARTLNIIKTVTKTRYTDGWRKRLIDADLCTQEVLDDHYKMGVTDDDERETFSRFVRNAICHPDFLGKAACEKDLREEKILFGEGMSRTN
jgi:hypothetical protein